MDIKQPVKTYMQPGLIKVQTLRAARGLNDK